MSDVKIEGLNNLLAKLNEYADPAQLKQTMGKCCAIVEASAKEKAPKDTGALRRSISSRVEETANGVEGVIFTPLEYAPYIEYGTGLCAEDGGRQTPWSYQDDEGNWHTTKGQPPRPYMRPALTENRDQILEKLKGAIIK